MRTFLLALLLSGCYNKHYTQLTEQVAEYGLQRYEDSKKGVFCYIYRDKDNSSLQCLKKD